MNKKNPTENTLTQLIRDLISCSRVFLTRLWWNNFSFVTDSILSSSRSMTCPAFSRSTTSTSKEFLHKVITL